MNNKRSIVRAPVPLVVVVVTVIANHDDDLFMLNDGDDKNLSAHKFVLKCEREREGDERQT